MPSSLRTPLKIAALAVACGSSAVAQTPPKLRSVVSAEFVFETAPFASAHASTIVETKSGLVVAWFAGSHEGAPDVGIWLARRAGSTWSAPRLVATGRQADGARVPCWNPVLFRTDDGSLLLFYKVGPQVAAWWGMVQTSHDDGLTWSDARRLPSGILGPIKNKPVQLGNGVILSGSSTESFDSPPTWRVHFERSVDRGKTWTSVTPTPALGTEIEAIQPAILVYGYSVLQAVGRSRAGRVFQTWSHDGGLTWDALSLTELPNPNSGIDAVTLRDGRQLIVYNHTTQGRSPLNVAISTDGRSWQSVLALESEPGEYSYPAVIQTADGLVHITYTWRRERIKHVVLDPATLTP